MTMTHLDVLNKDFPVRKSDAEKKRFREWLISTLEMNKITASVETTRNGKNKNVIVGNPETAKTVFAAHYDTPAKSIVPNLMMPKNVVLLYLFHMIPILVILAASLIPAKLISSASGIPMLYPPVFLVLYFGLFYLLYFAIPNKNNFILLTAYTLSLANVPLLSRQDDALVCCAERSSPHRGYLWLRLQPSSSLR